MSLLGILRLRERRGGLAFRKATASDLSQLETWLVDRVLEHERPTLLLRMLRQPSEQRSP